MARDAFSGRMQSKDTDSADRYILESKACYQKVLAIDPCWQIENGCIALLAGSEAEQRVMQRVSDLMPSADKPNTVQPAIASLEGITSEESFKLTHARSSHSFSWPTRQETTAPRRMDWEYQQLQIHTI